MRRHVLHYAAALLAFTVGFLTVCKSGNLALALPLALLIFVLAKIITGLNIKLPSDFDSHKVKVATLTFLLWIPILAIYLPLLIPQSGLGNCMPEIPEEEFIARPTYPQRVPEDTVITMERTGCYGRCPSYTLSIFADGAVIFYGRPRNGFTKVTGAARSWISQEQLRQLISEFERAGYFSLNNRYEAVSDGCPTMATDSPSVITSIQINGRKKTIQHYHGCIMKGRDWAVFPKELTGLENRIDEATDSWRWVKSDD